MIEIIGLGIAFIASTAALIVQTLRIKRANIAKFQSEVILKEADKRSNQIIRDAQSKAAKDSRSMLNRAQDNIKHKKRQIEDEERQLKHQRKKIDEKKNDLDRLQDKLDQRMESIKELRRKQEEIVSEMFQKLESVASLTREEAEKTLMEHVEVVAKKRAGATIRSVDEQTKRVAKQKATEVVLESIQKLGVEVVSSNTTAMVNLPDDEIKGRIIGKEGRNIRAFETVTGVDVIIDDTPGGVIISCFDPIRREIARMTLDKLVTDGRINPARIEDAYQKSQDEIQVIIKQKGEKAADILGLEFTKEIIAMLGRLNYRTSYGQNILDHSVEVSKIAGIIAERLGVDVQLAKRGGVLHDIGKAIDFVSGGSHDDLGAEICRRNGESPELINCIMAHHEDEEPDTVEAVIVKVADALSSARPGARKESVELYLKRLENLEKIAYEFDGVQQVFAIQAGREVRVIVNPEDVSDDSIYKMSQDIAERIERELDYPGEVKVNLVRETRAISIAH